jgi:hypothetical protein
VSFLTAARRAPPDEAYAEYAEDAEYVEDGFDEDEEARVLALLGRARTGLPGLLSGTKQTSVMANTMSKHKAAKT